jgi:hypothetical protein
VNKKLLSTLLGLFVSGGVTLALDQPETSQPPKVATEAATAIQALGGSPTTKQISAVVFKAVRSSPDNVLPIVDAAIRVSPLSAASEIVIAATAGIPHPWKQVSYRRLATPNAKTSGTDYKGGPDDRQSRDGGRNVDFGGRQPDLSRGSIVLGLSVPSFGDPGTNSANGTQMTLAEAIVRTAFDAQPGLSFSTLQSAVNTALLMDPATLMRYIQSPNAVSGVGDAGFSNYANEPLTTPKQPAVSR